MSLLALTLNALLRCVIRREVGVICCLMGYCAANGGNFVPTFRETYRFHLLGSRNLDFLTLGDGTDWLS
jgi:hypothetical protein